MPPDSMIRMTEFLAVVQADKAIFWPASGIKERNQTRKQMLIVCELAKIYASVSSSIQMELLKLLSMTLMLAQMHNYTKSKQNLLRIIDDFLCLYRCI